MKTLSTNSYRCTFLQFLASANQLTENNWNQVVIGSQLLCLGSRPLSSQPTIQSIPIRGPLAAGPLITLNTNIIIVNAPPHSWALISSCDVGGGGGGVGAQGHLATWHRGVPGYIYTGYIQFDWTPCGQQRKRQRDEVAKQMPAISAGGARSIRPDIKLNCRTRPKSQQATNVTRLWLCCRWSSFSWYGLHSAK